MNKNITDNLCQLSETLSSDNFEKFTASIRSHPDELDYRNSEEYTPLMILIRFSHRDSVYLRAIDLVLKLNIDCSVTTRLGETPLTLCIHHMRGSDRLTMMQIILKHVGLDWKAFFMAVRFSRDYDSMDVIKLFLDKGLDINIRSPAGLTALMVASRYSATTSHIDIVKFLLLHDADPNLQSINGTALAQAVENQESEADPDVVRLLLEYTDFDICNMYFIHLMTCDQKKYARFTYAQKEASRLMMRKVLTDIIKLHKRKKRYDPAAAQKRALTRCVSMSAYTKKISLQN